MKPSSSSFFLIFSSTSSFRARRSALLALAHEWLELIERGEVLTLENLVERTEHHRSHVRRVLKLAFLAPDIQRAILAGHQPKSLTLAALADIDLPLLWQNQRTLLSVAPT